MPSGARNIVKSTEMVFSIAAIYLHVQGLYMFMLILNTLKYSGTISLKIQTLILYKQVWKVSNNKLCLHGEDTESLETWESLRHFIEVFSRWVDRSRVISISHRALIVGDAWPVAMSRLIVGLHIDRSIIVYILISKVKLEDGETTLIIR